MDLSQIKNKLAAVSSKAGKGEKKPNVFWKPTVGKQTIRVIPSKFNKKDPFTELFLNYKLGKTILSPTNFGEKCPIDQFVKKLRETSDKENWKLSGKLESKMRVFLPVVERGKESEGVKLWAFGKELYMDFLNLADNEDVGDFTDILEGRDIVVTTVGPDVTGTEFNKSSIMPRTKQTPLSDDKKLVKLLLEEQPDPKEAFPRYTFDEIKEMLHKFLSPEEESEGEVMDIKKDSKPESKKEVSTTKNEKGKKFDNLFEDEK